MRLQIADVVVVPFVVLTVVCLFVCFISCVCSSLCNFNFVTHCKTCRAFAQFSRLRSRIILDKIRSESIKLNTSLV